MSLTPSPASSRALDWLIGSRFHALTKTEYEWEFVFEGNTQLFVACLWRLIENGQMVATSQDDGHIFGRPVPMNATAEFNQRLCGVTVQGVDLGQSVCDLFIRFTTGHVVQMIPVSAGYEAWRLSKGGRLYVAGGDGLSVFGDPV